MSPSSRFPDLREYRARATRLGHRTGADDENPVSAPAGSTTPAPWPWLIAGLAAVGLLGWLAHGEFAGPEIAGTPVAAVRAPIAPVPMVPAPTAMVPAPTPALAERAAEAVNSVTLPARLAQAESELSALRREATALRTANVELSRRIELIEQAFGPATGSIGPAAAGDSALSGSSVDGGRGLLPDVSTLSSRLPDGTTPGAVSDLIAGIGAERSTVTTNFTFALDLGGFGDVAELKRYWARLVGDNPLLLGGLVPRQVTEIAPDGIRSFRLIAGPVADVTDAERLCRQIVQRGSECYQTINSGAPL